MGDQAARASRLGMGLIASSFLQSQNYLSTPSRRPNRSGVTLPQSRLSQFWTDLLLPLTEDSGLSKPVVGLVAGQSGSSTRKV